MGLFSRRLTDSQKKEALALVNHLQTMLAYQQLAMEIYNDAVANDTGEIPHGGEVTERTNVTFSSPFIVAKYAIPALEKKIEIFELMETKHREASVLETANFQQPYKEMTVAISEMMDRARFMRQGFKQWVNNEVTNIDVTGLDGNELAAVDRAIKSLNELIFKKLGLTSDEWLDIVQKSTNYVRASVKLMPLTKEIFRSRYMSGINGEHVRFYSD
jgi:hypothetical protein